MTENRKHSFGPRMARRTFVASAAAVAGAAGLAGVLPENLARAATMSPREFDLSQVKHLVFLMQENRSFDHYFGTFPGARGFNDPTAIRLPTGRSVFQQPDPANPDGYLEPWHMSTITTIGSKSGFDEHPAAIPAAGAQFLATKLEALAANEELWNTTVFIINYDENDGFFDHVVPPTPNHAEYPEEFITLASQAPGGLPLGAGSGSRPS